MSKTGKNILDLESLTKKYDNLIIQYNQAQIDYANYLNQTKNTENLTSIKGFVSFDPQMVIKKASNLQQCIALCSADSTCKSATFNPIDYSQPQCWLNRNEVNVIAAPGSNNYAIIPKEKQFLLKIQSLNSQLSDVNSKILKFIQGNKSLYNNIIDERNLQFTNLQKNLHHLKLEKINLEHKIKEFDSLDEEQKYTDLTINKNYYSYIVLLLLFCICVFILSKIAISKLLDQNDLQSLNIGEILITVIISGLIIGLILFFTKKKNKTS